MLLSLTVLLLLMNNKTCYTGTVMSNQDPALDQETSKNVIVSPPPQVDCKAYTRQRLSVFIPILQKIAVGDFSVEFEMPSEEDELTELATALSLMLDDLREYKKTQEELTTQLQGKIKELETFNSAMVHRELKMVALKEENASLKAQLGASKKE
jgi:hypothetical protein